jgi:hypothetical protein
MSPDHPVLAEGRSIFQKRVFHPSVLPRMLKGGFNSAKIGKDVTKGRWRGFPIFTLTLEERRTCPRSCKVWAQCFGNNMHMAERIMHGEALEMRLLRELDALQNDHPDGFVIRLHVLGDFYSADYVRFWAEALDHFPALNVFGYTAHPPDDRGIGSALLKLTVTRWERFALRFSGSGAPLLSTLVIRDPADCPPGATICPAQTGKTDRCGTCTLCWAGKRPVAFLEH